MTQVRTKATAKPSHQPSTLHQSGTFPQSGTGTAAIEPELGRTAPPAAGRLIVGTLVLAAAALTVATRAPLATTVLGLIAFGVLHNVLEIRYVAGRFSAVLSGRFLTLLLVLISGIVVCRVASGWLPVGGRLAEIVLGYLVLGVGCWMGLGTWRGGPWALPAAWLVLASACAVSLVLPAYYFVVLTHLHNLVPLFFVWEWARRIRPPSARAAFRLTQVLWIVVLPLAILAGAFDRAIVAAPGVVERFVGDGSRVLASSAPPDLAHTLGLRFLVMFAFMQTMHYVVWVGFLPRFAPDATAAFESRVPWLRGWRAWALGLGAGGLLAVLFLSDYFQGRALYGALASYHAYLEFPVLLALLAAPRKAGGRSWSA